MKDGAYNKHISFININSKRSSLNFGSGGNSHFKRDEGIILKIEYL